MRHEELDGPRGALAGCACSTCDCVQTKTTVVHEVRLHPDSARELATLIAQILKRKNL